MQRRKLTMIQTIQKKETSFLSAVWFNNFYKKEDRFTSIKSLFISKVINKLLSFLFAKPKKPKGVLVTFDGILQKLFTAKNTRLRQRLLTYNYSKLERILCKLEKSSFSQPKTALAKLKFILRYKKETTKPFNQIN